MLNPWKVQNIHDFNYYCCPECVFRSKEDMSFQAHALQNHVLSRSFFHGTKDNEDQSNLYRGIDNCSSICGKSLCEDNGQQFPYSFSISARKQDFF